MSRQIFITTVDKERLIKLINEEKEFSPGKKEYLRKLERELERAQVVVSDDIPHNVITMNSQVSLKDMETGETMTYTLVYPSEANLLENKISIMAPVGTAILGFCEGDIISWEVPDGVVKLQVEKILYQPEAAGDLDL
ncbi:MAG: nucleoside diphosphate kinase regulator [Peptococcaceae bacterium]|jgi:regulator of nucleoside diphosphate kinase|nr:nucleoside diphosphate kinase regulator [Peptococcaceae bacterium]